MVGISSLLLVLASCAACILALLFDLAQAQAQNQFQAAADPAEVIALNSIFQKWRILAPSNQWNISGEPCSGAAIDSTSIDDQNNNPFIKCDCSYNSNSTCHITQLKVYALNIVGVIPDELWTLTFLFNLNLGQNYLTGNLPASIGNLFRMQYMSFGINALSGTLPKELGNLTNLVSLSLSTNNFTGSLPSELGNLVQLQQIYLDSSGVSGEIPSTFAKLQNLQQMWASDTELTGRIPDFIGNWLKLTSLRLQGNSFEGPIPPTFSNLNSLTDLRISDLSNGSSSLAFIKDMKSLIILVLRNNNISESIPSNIGEYQNLTHLDLSFNNITGQIPDSLFNLSSLSYLFLGNNELSGTLPAQKRAPLLNIDLSYNSLEGSFPSWVSEENLQLNLVANKFTIESSSSSVLPSGLNCIQRGFHCNRGTGRYSDFAIKCGGPPITSSNGIVYEGDNETLGPATYHVINTDRWAVSNVGYFSGSNNPQYSSYSISQITSTSDSELFRTARLSASSLRYYGLGLGNGNYSVILQFVETAIDNANTWKSLGRRVFDIYIQGNLVLKDFDIRKDAGGVSFVAVQKEFKVQVSENYLEIHLFWAGKGTCCVPTRGTYGPSISAIMVTSDFVTTISKRNPSSKKKWTGLIVGLVVGVGGLSLLSVFWVFCIVQRRKPQSNELHEIQPKIFSYAELQTATKDFNSDNKLGQGGFGAVYKGTLNDGRNIAVKQLSVTSRQGEDQFKAEIAIISAVQHRNLVKLYGYCIEGDKKLLVYEYLENKSLDQALFGERTLNLDWSTRYNICLGVAKGLNYLHEESWTRIVHRDVKPGNILLDSNLLPKISDFGMAKLYDVGMTHISSDIKGTPGYLAPEYAIGGRLTEKTDVFAFGVMALKVVSGRRFYKEQVYLPDLAWKLYRENNEANLLDPTLVEFKVEDLKRLIGVSLWCTQPCPKKRPRMSRVVAMLSRDVVVDNEIPRPAYWRNDTSNVTRKTTTTGTNTDYYSLSISSLASEWGEVEDSPKKCF